MADRSVAIKLTADVKSAVSGLKAAQTAAEDLAGKGLDKIGKKSQESEDATRKLANMQMQAAREMAAAEEESSRRRMGAINTLSNGFGALGLAMVGAASLAVKAFADFDQAMSNVAATGDDARGSLDALRVAAMDAGARTAFSATEAAGAIEELAKAGVSAADILNGGLDGALDLAAAGGLEVADAAGIAATAIQQFGLRGEDMTHVADLLAAGAGKAMGSVDDLGAALKQSGLVADQTGLTIEETTAALAAFASAGLLGSDAGTSLKTMLQRLNPTTKEAQAQFDSLGVSAYDASGNFVGLEDFAGQLQTSMKDLTPEARNAALAVMFGSDAVRGAAVLYEEGAAGIAEWTAAVDDQGYAAEVAATKMDNLAGDLETLQGAFETMLIGLGEGGNGPLRSLTQGLTDAVDKFSELPAAAQNATLAIVGGGGLVALGLAGLGKLAIGTNDAITALKDMGLVSDVTAGKMGKFAGSAAKIAGVAAGIAAVATALGAISDAQAPAVAGVEATTQALLDLEDACDIASIDALFEDFAKTGTLIGEAQGSVNDFESALDSLLGQQNQIENFFSGIFGYDTEASKSAAQFEQIGASLASLVQSGNADLAAEQFETLAARTEAAGYSTDELLALMPPYSEALAGVENEAKLAAEGQDEFGSATADATDAAVEQVDVLQDLIDGQSELAGIALSARDAQRNLEAALDDATAALETNGQTLDITTEKGRANQTALDDIGQSTWDLIEAMKANRSSQADIQGVMATSRDRFVEAAGAMGMGADEANALADELGLIPTNVNVDVAVDVATGAATAALDAWQARENARNRSVRIQTIIASGGNTGAGLATGGFVSGPGSGTSDSIPARLSNGEYVVKASAVAQYGRAFFDTVNAQRFATGGFVGTQAAAPVAGVQRHTELHVHNEGKRDVTTQDIVFAQARLEALEPAW